MLGDIADGFTLHPGLIEYPGNYETMAIGQFELLRRSKTYRPYIVRLPEGSQQIPAYGNYSYQVHLKPGSWIYGLQMILINVAGLPEFPFTPAALSLQITETYSGAQIFNEHTRSQFLYPPAWYSLDRLHFHPLCEPKVVIDPGDIDVEVCNLTDSARSWQLLIFTAEPYELVEA